MDLIASLCHNYRTSEECLKEMMDKSHKAIEDVFSTKALSASECKTENFDKIDTCMEPFLTYLCTHPRGSASANGNRAKDNARQGRQMGKRQSKAPSPLFHAVVHPRHCHSVRLGFIWNSYLTILSRLF